MNSMLRIALVCAVALAILVGVIAYSIRKLAERRRLACPVRLRPASVLFSLSPTGERLDVLRCSIFGRRSPSCGKVCVHPAR